MKFSFKKPENFYAYNKLPMPTPSTKSALLKYNKGLPKSNPDINLQSSLFDSEIKGPERLKKQLNTDQPDKRTQIDDPISERYVVDFPLNDQILSMKFKTETESNSERLFIKTKPNKESIYIDVDKGENKDSVINFVSFKNQDITDQHIVLQNTIINKRITIEKRDPVINQQFQEYEKTIQALEIVNKDLADKLKTVELMNQSRLQDSSIRVELIDQNRQILTQLTDLQKMNQSLRSELDSSKNDRKQESEYWKLQTETREARIKQLEKQFQEKKSQLKEYQNEIEAMKQGLEKFDVNITELFSVKRELGSLKLQLASIEREKTEISLQLETKQAENNHIKLVLEKVKSESNQIITYKEIIKRLEEENKLLIAKNRSDNSDKENVNSQLIYMQNRIKSLEDENVQGINDRKRVTDLLGQLHDMETLHIDLKSTLDRKEALYNRKVDELESNKRMLLIKQNQLTQEIEKASKQHENSLKSIKIDKDIYQAQKLDELQRENNRLALELHQIIDEREFDKNDLDYLQTNNTRLTRALEDRETTIKHLNEKIQQLELKNLEPQQPVHQNPPDYCLINDFLKNVEIERIYSNSLESECHLKQSNLITNDTTNVITTLQESLLKSKINEIDKLKTENERLLVYVEAYKTNTLEMEEKVHKLIIRHENLKEKLKKYESACNESQINSTRTIEVESLLYEIKDIKMKNRVLESENKKLNMFVLDSMRKFG